MNSRPYVFPIFLWMLGLVALAIVAISPLIALGYNEIVFTVAPALQAVSTAVFGH